MNFKERRHGHCPQCVGRGYIWLRILKKRQRLPKHGDERRRTSCDRCDAGKRYACHGSVQECVSIMGRGGPGCRYNPRVAGN